MRKALGCAILMVALLASWASAQVPAREKALGLLMIPVAAPEPSSPALLAIDLFSVGGLVFLVRRRMTGKNR